MPKNNPPSKKTTRRKATVKTDVPIPVTVEKSAIAILASDQSGQRPGPAPASPKTWADGKPKKLSAKRLWLRVASIVLVIIGLAVIIYPFWPEIQYKLWPPNENNALGSLTVSSAKTANANTFVTGKLPINHPAVEGENRIIIPKIGVDMKIVEGATEKALNLGAWHLAYTSSPDQGGNTVITAHRYKYRPPSKETFYLLDKLVVGDTFTVNWQGLEYKYQVTETKVVNPTDIYVLNPTSNPQVTLITCTPLFTTKQRLVVVGQEIP